MVEPRIRITIVKKMNMNELYEGKPGGVTPKTEPVCEYFEEGQDFVVDFAQNDPVMPKGFCSGAWNDIFRWISALRYGGDFEWIEERGTMIACCTDGLRPVVFRLERIE